MNKENKTYCYMCGEEITDEIYEDENGNSICQSCYDDHYYACDDCGRIINRDDGIYVESEDRLVCQDCLDTNYFICESCGEYHHQYNSYYVQHYGDICEDCLNNSGDFFYCHNCGDLYHIDDLTYNDRMEDYYCNDCYEEESDDLLYDYHEFNDWKFFKGINEEKAPYYIGKEIELEPLSYSSGDNLGCIVDTMKRFINGVGMHDGSLSNNGIEVVTHPESWKYLLENKENYKNFFERVQSYNYGNGGNTGLHFHVSRPSDDVVSRIIVILESFKDEIKTLSRRNGNWHWSAFISDGTSDDVEKLKYQSTKYLKDNYVSRGHDRYVALNLNNRNTIEFRFFSGANNFEEFWGALQFIHNIMDVALDEKRDINTITWSELINGEEIEEQAKKTGVYGIEKQAKETTEILDKIEEMKVKTKEEIKKTLKNFIKYLSREMSDKKLNIINKNDVNTISINSSQFIETLTNDLRNLQRLTSIYNDIDDYSIKSIKNDLEYTKERYFKKEYSRYFKLMEKTFKKFESEVLG